MKKVLMVVLALIAVAVGIAVYKAAWIIAMIAGVAFLISLALGIRSEGIVKYFRGWWRLKTKETLKGNPKVVYEAEVAEGRKNIGLIQQAYAALFATVKKYETEEKNLEATLKDLEKEILDLHETNSELAAIKAVSYQGIEKQLESIKKNLETARKDSERMLLEKTTIESKISIRLSNLKLSAIKAEGANARKEAYASMGDKSLDWNSDDSQALLDESADEDEALIASYGVMTTTTPTVALEDFMSKHKKA